MKLLKLFFISISFYAFGGNSSGVHTAKQLEQLSLATENFELLKFSAENLPVALVKETNVSLYDSGFTQLSTVDGEALQFENENSILKVIESPPEYETRGTITEASDITIIEVDTTDF